MEKILLSLSILGIIHSYGQMAPTRDATVETYAGTINANDFKAHLTFLADDLLEGRKPVPEDQKLAAAYIRTQFMRLGLKPGNPTDGSYYQKYNLLFTTINSAEIKLKGETYAYREDFFSLRPDQLPDKLDGELIYAGYGISSDDYDNLKGLDIKGKMPVVFAGSPDSQGGRLREQLNQWMEKGKMLADKGASGVLMILPDSSFKPLARYARNRSMQVTSNEAAAKPVIYISEKFAEALIKGGNDLTSLKKALKKQAKIKDVALATKKLDFKAEIERENNTAENVVGLLEGSEHKDEIIVLTAHFDHIGIQRGQINNGADDDGSGTTAIIELAEAFTQAAAAGNGPKRSILFMTVSGEEKGLLGSEFYTSHPLYPLDNTVANLNIDMIGRIDKKYEKREDSTNYVYLIGSDKLSSELHQISEAMNDTYTDITLDYTYNDENDPNRFYYRSDHYNFAKNNIPVIFYFTGVHKDYHRPTDDVEKIRFEKTAKITRLVFATAWELANRADRIKVDSNKK